jgi:hypothetical protein
MPALSATTLALTGIDPPVLIGIDPPRHLGDGKRPSAVAKAIGVGSGGIVRAVALRLY